MPANHRYVPLPEDPDEHPLRNLIPAYERARDALAEAKTLDEVKSIPEEFDRLRAVGRIVDDFEFELMLAEIKLREVRRLGEISLGLDKAKGGRGKTVSDDGNGFKLDTLRRAGIARSTAYRAEVVATIELRHFEDYLKECRSERKPVTVNALLEKVSTRCQVAELDDGSLDTRTREERANRHARHRQHEVASARKPLDKILRLIERKLTNDEQRIEVALVAASRLGLPRDREMLIRLLSEDKVAEGISRRKGEERSLHICRLIEDSLSHVRDEELANEGFMPQVRESVQRRMVKAEREARAEAEDGLLDVPPEAGRLDNETTRTGNWIADPQRD
jgi:hypothetical protein